MSSRRKNLLNSTLIVKINRSLHCSIRFRMQSGVIVDLAVRYIIMPRCSPRMFLASKKSSTSSNSQVHQLLGQRISTRLIQSKSSKTCKRQIFAPNNQEISSQLKSKAAVLKAKAEKNRHHLTKTILKNAIRLSIKRRYLLRLIKL